MEVEAEKANVELSPEARRAKRIVDYQSTVGRHVRIQAEAAEAKRVEAAEALRQAEAVVEKSRHEPNAVPAYLAREAAALVARDKAETAFETISIKADQAVKEALQRAGDNPVNREQARARAISAHAEDLGRAEAKFIAASLAFDRSVVETARESKVVEHRIKAAQARMAAREAEEADVLRKSNPFADPVKPTITQSQFDSIRDPALKAKAGKEANIIPDDDPELTLEEVRAVLRKRGSADRVVMTRSAFDALEPADRMSAAKSCIIID